MMPAEALDSPTARKILRVLAEKNRRYTIDELADMCHRTPSMISRVMREVKKYPFLTEGNVEGSRRKLYGLDSRNEYTGAIKRFFDIEREQERQTGTVPVDVWNLLEDVTVDFAAEVDGFLELFLFGSYATGEYYAGSDIDLVMVVEGDDDASSRARARLDAMAPSKDIQLFVATDRAGRDGDTSPDDLRNTARSQAPVPDGEPLIALWGFDR